MKRIFTFSNNIFKNNFRKSFFTFCLFKNFKLIKFLFLHLWYKLLLTFKLIKRNSYLKKYYAFLDDVDIEKISILFWSKYDKKINYSLLKDKDIVVDEAPEILFKPLSLKIKGNNTDFKSNDDLIKENITENTEVYLNRYNKKFKNSSLYIKIGSKYYLYGKYYFRKITFTYLLYVLMIFLLSFILSAISLYFSTGEFGMDLYKFYFQSKKILFLNTVPIFLTMVLFILFTNSLGIGFIITTILTIVMTMINYFKIIFRNDPFVYLDITLASEAKEMLNTYTLNFPISFVCIIILVLIISIFLLNFFKTKIDFIILRLFLIIIVIATTFIFYNKILLSDNIYSSIVVAPGINTNSQTHNFVNRGFIYPFIYSTKSKGLEKPIDYSETSARKALSEYKYYDIDNQKKVHILSVMLESFSDLSEIEEFKFKIDIYKNWHELERKSYSGNLITSVFAGGTINTERKFLTGYTVEPHPRAPLNSYVQYLDEQGYVTRGLHPGFSWFYNRVNVNEYLGFQSYDFWGDLNRTDLKEEYLWNGFANDKYVFEDIINNYEKAKADNEYLFNFSVTYQNHGPQKSDYKGKEYIVKKDDYDVNAYNSTNYYFDGIYNTIKEVTKLKDALEKEQEPIVLILFGDHKPELGTNRGGYTMLDINLDTSTKEGLTNFYQTPYIIWANEKAKNILNNDFKGKGPTISPNYLMNEFFKLAGYKGNKYIQYTTDLEESISVIQKETFMENGKYTDTLTSEGKKKYQEFKNVEYYYYTKKYEESKNS